MYYNLTEREKHDKMVKIITDLVNLLDTEDEKEVIHRATEINLEIDRICTTRWYEIVNNKERKKAKCEK